jgi:hypothetical protein
MNLNLIRAACLAVALATLFSIFQSATILRTSEVMQLPSHQSTELSVAESTTSVALVSTIQTAESQNPIDRFLDEELSKDPLSLSDQGKVDDLVGTIKSSEWLGPLAPIAISPFFGIACLCGISQFGGSYLPVNSFVSTNPVLNNPTVLWVFVGLTLLTSLPRLTKVSKPAAQAIDQLEAWAGIITLLIIRFAATSAPAVAELSQEQFVQMGALSFTADTLMMIAAVINIFVINTVKFFYEVLVWLIPIPFVDAMLEVGNKSTCAALMAIYAWNPFVATIINLLLFAACLLMFRWVSRQTAYMRSILFDPIRAKFSPAFGIPEKDQLVVFPNEQFGPFASKTKLHLVPVDGGWQLQQHRVFLPARTMDLSNQENQLAIHKGLLVNRITVAGNQNGKLLFTKRFSDHLVALSDRIKVPVEHDKAMETGTMEMNPA